MSLKGRTILEGNADAVEFCPTHPFHTILAAATYTLKDDQQQQQAPLRLGTLSLFSLPTVIDGHASPLQKLQHLETSGIFDIKWRPTTQQQEQQPYLAQASADGTLTLYQGLIDGNNNLRIREVAKETICSSMCLSVDWDPHRLGSRNNRISVSHSEGLVSVVEVGESEIKVEQSGKAHEFEVWTSAHDKWKPDLFYTGGDDCHFCGWDPRVGLARPVFRERRVHRMGVCSIQSDLYGENVVATGSYDEELRLWDCRVLDRPLVTTSLGLGGGVWKLKWHPLHKGLLLAACMHSGFVLVQVGESKVEEVERYNGHDSLAYGADWFKGADASRHVACDDGLVIRQGLGADGNMDSDGGRLAGASQTCNYLVATCSFYDCALHVWNSKNLK